MEYLQALESGSSPKIQKAAKAISKKSLSGYCAHLTAALKEQIKNPKSWETQCELIKAIGKTGCVEVLPLLKDLINKDYESTILYSELAFSILLIENISESNIDFLFQSLEKRNVSQIAGACAALLYRKIIPTEEEISQIVSEIVTYTEDEGHIITPRGYIAAIAYLWPASTVKDFLESCKKSSSRVISQIAEDSLHGKKSKFQLI